MEHFQMKSRLSERFDSGNFHLPNEKWEKVKDIAKRIKWKNVILAFVLVIGFSYGVVSITKGVIGYLQTEKEVNQEEYLAKEIAKYDIVEYVIQEGDTVWSIQKQLTPNERDLRHTIYLSGKLNGIDHWGVIVPGERLLFVKEKQ